MTFIVKNRQSFTLVELLVASVIFAVLMVSLYTAFQSGIFGYKKINRALDTTQEAVLVMERLNLDLRNSFVFSSAESKFRGEGAFLGFLTIVDEFSEGFLRPAYCFVAYEWDGRRLTRLCRRGKDSLNEKLTDEPEEIAPGDLREVVFNYAAGQKEGLGSWKTSWEDKKTLPAAVRIVLTFRDKADVTRKIVFTRTIFLKV